MQLKWHTGNEDEFERLLVDGVNVNATDENGATALLLASEKGDNFWWLELTKVGLCMIYFSWKWKFRVEIFEYSDQK